MRAANAKEPQLIRKYYRLPLPSPFDWDRMLAFLKPRATPGVETTDSQSYRRSFEWGSTSGCLTVTAVSKSFLGLKVICNAPVRLTAVTRRVGRIFDLDAPVAAVRRRLGKDRLLANALKHLPAPRVPGAWDGFELAVRAVIGQQVAVKSATTVAGRLVNKFGRRLPASIAFSGRGPTHLFPEPAALARAPLAEMGMPRKRAKTIRALAEAVTDGRLKIDPSANSSQTIESLKGIPGIGDWTAQYVAMRALRQPDAFPAADLGLLKAAADGRDRLTPTRLEAMAEAWRPFRAYAAVLLWASLERTST